MPWTSHGQEREVGLDKVGPFSGSGLLHDRRWATTVGKEGNRRNLSTFSVGL